MNVPQQLGTVTCVIVLLTAACAPSRYDFQDRILEPLATEKANELAERNKAHIRQAFEEASYRNQLPGERWFGLFYWSLDALGFAGYGMPGQGRVVETFKEWFHHASAEKHEAELKSVLVSDRRAAHGEYSRHFR